MTVYPTSITNMFRATWYVLNCCYSKFRRLSDLYTWKGIRVIAITIFQSTFHSSTFFLISVCKNIIIFCYECSCSSCENVWDLEILIIYHSCWAIKVEYFTHPWRWRFLRCTKCCFVYKCANWICRTCLKAIIPILFSIFISITTWCIEAWNFA